MTEEAFDIRTRAKIAKRSPYGVEVKAGETYYWCTCGHSKNQPFCDGSHMAVNEAEGTKFAPRPYKAEEDTTAYFCGCKQTANPPFCDGTHASLPAPPTEDDGIARQEFTDGSQTYPPRKGGLNGQADGAFDLSHEMAFSGKSYGDFADKAEFDKDLDGNYDLIVIGGGVSGLAAAHFYKQRSGKGNDAKILIVDCLEDFGGHCKRNEFVLPDGRVILGYGGSESFQSPVGNFSQEMHTLVSELGIDLNRFETEFFKTDTYPSLGMSRGSFFKKAETLVTGDPTPMVADDLPHNKTNPKPLDTFINEFPFANAETKKALIACFRDKTKVTLSEMGDIEAICRYLSETNYVDFLLRHWALPAEAVEYLRRRTLDFFGLPADAVSALDAAYYGHPGFQGLTLPPNEEAECEMKERYIHHFPDGNASLARLLVAKLIPTAFVDVADASILSPQDLLLKTVDYDKLDSADNNVRIRLSTTAVRAKTTGVGANLAFIKHSDKVLRLAKATHIVAACFNMALPYIIDELSPQEGQQNPRIQEQRDALKGNVKAPLVYTNVVLKNWRAFAALGVHEVYPVDGFHCRIKLDYPVAMGEYKHSAKPDDPVVVHMVYVPDSCVGKAEAPEPRAALRGARSMLFGLDRQAYEDKIREDLTALLGPAGFDFNNDVMAITVNRWSHGYAWVANSLSGGNPQKEMADARRHIHGQISIANSDAGHSAYLHAAVDEAFRAVNDLSFAPQVKEIPIANAVSHTQLSPSRKNNSVNVSSQLAATPPIADRIAKVVSSTDNTPARDTTYTHDVSGSPVTDDHLRVLFNSYDTDKSGHLDREEFKKIYLGFENFGLPPSKQETDILFSRYSGGDKKINYEEFCIIMLQRSRQ